jgi:16S rRNA processing protein RimM
MTTQPDSLIIGQIAAPFGIKGELKVNILTEFPDRFNKLEAVILAPADQGPGIGDLGSVEDRRQTADGAQDPGNLQSPNPLIPNPQSHIFRPSKGPAWFSIEAVRAHKGQALLKLLGVDDANAAETLRGYLLLVPIEQARKLPRGAYYLYQIEGLEVYTTGGELVGKIDEVLSMAANDVYVVRGPGVEDPTGELLVPAVKEIVKKIDVEGGRVVIMPLSEWA